VGGLAKRGDECVRGERRGHWLEEKEEVVVAGSGIACWDEREVGGVAGNDWRLEAFAKREGEGWACRCAWGGWGAWIDGRKWLGEVESRSSDFVKEGGGSGEI